MVEVGNDQEAAQEELGAFFNGEPDDVPRNVNGLQDTLEGEEDE